MTIAEMKKFLKDLDDKGKKLSFEEIRQMIRELELESSSSITTELHHSPTSNPLLHKGEADAFQACLDLLEYFDENKPVETEPESTGIRKTTLEELHSVPFNVEGLVLQGCGGNLWDWINGINDCLNEEGILLNGRFGAENVSQFNTGEITNLLFSFTNGVELDMGKLAMWRLKTHASFGGTWLSDYLDNSKYN